MPKKARKNLPVPRINFKLYFKMPYPPYLLILPAAAVNSVCRPMISAKYKCVSTLVVHINLDADIGCSGLLETDAHLLKVKLVAEAFRYRHIIFAERYAVFLVNHKFRIEICPEKHIFLLGTF